MASQARALLCVERPTAGFRQYEVQRSTSERALAHRRLSCRLASSSGRSGAAPAQRVAARASAAPARESSGQHAAQRPAASKTFDLVCLSNLCVDLIANVDALPPEDPAARRALLDALTASPPPMERWEVGGNTNTLIAAARLGMRVAAVGHVGDDRYGSFLADILQAEGVRIVSPAEPEQLAALPPEQRATLLCFVLVAPGAAHAFCSRYDFGPWPLLPAVRGLPLRVKQVLESTHGLFINGFAFDDLPSDVVVEAARYARAAGAAVFFDPGPRAWTFRDGGDREAALAAMLDASDVVLATEEEISAVTGAARAEDAARRLLRRPGAATEWCVVKRGAAGALLASRSGGLVEQRALQVDVRDTVGCGDSFAAAVALGFTREHSVPAVMALASAVGAATAMGTGAGRNVADAATVEALLRRAAPACADGRTAEALGVLHASLAGSMDFSD